MEDKVASTYRARAKGEYKIKLTSLECRDLET